MSRGRWLRRSLAIGGLTALVAAVTAAGLAARQDGWGGVFERPSGAKDEGLGFPGGRHGWLISAAGFIINTTDGGSTWTVQAEGKGQLRSIDFIDDRRGFAGTLTGILYGTTDGGTTWTDISAT